MAQRDILLRAGVRFSPSDIDTKAIRTALNKEITRTNVEISKVRLGREARTRVQDSFKNINFSVQKATLGRSGQTALRQRFREIPFSIDNVTFSARAIRSLQNQLRNTPVQLQQQQPGQGGQQGAANAANQTQNLANQTGNLANQQTRAAATSQELTGKTQQAANAMKRGQAQSARFSETLGRNLTVAENFGKTMLTITARFTAYLASLRIILGVQQAFINSLEAIFRFDNALQDLQKVLQQTPEGLAQVSRGLFSVARATGQSVDAVAESFGVFRRAIDDNEEALRRTEAALTAANISELTVAESTALVTSSLQIFGDELDNAIQGLDILSAISDSAATTATQLGRGVLRAGAAAQAVGVSFTELNAIIATTQEATQAGGAQIGSALKTIFARIAGSEQALRAQANAFGANITAADSVFQILQKLANIFPQLNREQKAQITQTVAGKRRFTEFNALLQNFFRVNELVAQAQGAQGTASAKQQAELDKLSTTVQQIQTEFTDFIVTLTGADQGAEGVSTLRNALGGVLDTVKGLGSVLNSIISPLKELEGAGAAITGAFIGVVQFGLFKVGPAIVRQLLTGMREFFKVTGLVANKAREIAQPIDAAQKEAIELRDAEEGVNQKLTRQRDLLREIQGIRSQTAPATGQGAGPGVVGAIPTGAQLDKQLSPVRTAFGKTANAVKTAGARVGQAFKNVVGSGLGLTVGISVAAAEANKFAQVVRDTGGAGAETRAKLIELGASTAQTSATMFLLLGRSKGAIASLALFGLQLISFARDLEKSAIQAREDAEASVRAVKVKEEEARASQFTTEALQELRDAGKVTADGLVREDLLRAASVRQLASENGLLARQIAKVTATLNELDKAALANARGIEGRRELQSAADAIKKRIFELDFTINAGGADRAFRPLIQQISEAQQIFDQFQRGGVGFDNADLSQQEALTAAVKESLDGSNLTSEELLAKYKLQTAELRNQDALLKSAREKANAISSENEPLLEQAKEDVRLAEEKLAELKKQESQIVKNENTEEARIAIAQRIGELEQGLVKAKANEADLDGKISSAQSRVAEIEKQRNGVIEETFKNARKFFLTMQLLKDQAELITKQTQAETAALQANTREIVLQADKRAEAARSSITGGTEQERQERAVAAIRDKSFEELRNAQEEAKRQQQAFNKLAEDLADRGFSKAAEDLRKAAAEVEAATTEKLGELEVQAKARFAAEVSEFNVKRIEEAEKVLEEARLNSIRRVVEAETAASQRRIDILRELEQQQNGADQARDLGFRPQPGLERQLGFFGAAIAEELERQNKIVIADILNEYDELRVGATSSVAELRAANQAVLDQEEEIARLRRAGASAEEIKEAESSLRVLQETLKEIANSGEDSAAKLKFVQQSISKLIQREEEKNAQVREKALDRQKKAAERVKNAEDALIEARNQIPALNAKIVESQRALASANAKVDEATQNLVRANQNLADEQFKLNFSIELAGFKARQSAGAFGSAQEAINAVAGAFNRAESSIKASSQAILEARRAALQEELSIVQSQLGAVESLALQAATATDEQLGTLTEQLATAQQIAKGEIGASEIGSLDPEILSGISQFTEVVPGLKEALRNIGAERLGLDPGIFQTFEDQLVQLQQGIAETGRGQLESAQQQVATAQQQLEEARQQKEIAQQNLDNSILAKEAALANVAAQAGQVTIQRASLGEIRRQTDRTLREFRPGRIASEETAAAVALLRGEEAKLIEEQKLIKEINAKSLESQQKTLEELQKQINDIKATKEAAEATADASAQTAETALGVKEDTAVTATSTAMTAENTGEANTKLDRSNTLLEQVVERLGNLSSGGLLSGIAEFFTNSASGTLSSGEIAGLLNAASREKRAMPAGSNLMLANTSETVLTNRQFKKFKRAASGHIPNAQGGFGDTSGIENMIGRVAEALAGLQNSTNQVAAAVTAQGPVQVNVDSQRSVTVNGLQELPSAVQRVVEDRIGGVPSAEEVNAIRDSVTEVLTRLRENGLEDFN